MSQDGMTRRIDRREFVSKLIPTVPEALVVTGLGSSSYDLYAAGDRDRNYYLWGAMGGAVSFGLGLALARPDDSVVVLTGDGEFMMGVGSLATVAVKAPRNLTIIVLDNGAYGETGMQASHTALGVDLVAVAAGMGIPHVVAVDASVDYDDIAGRIRKRRGAAFVQVHIGSDAVPRKLPARDGKYIKNRFRAALGLMPY